MDARPDGIRSERDFSRKKLATSLCGQGLDLDVVSEALDFGDEAFDLAWLGSALEVIGAEILIECSFGDHMVGGCEDRGGDRPNSFFGAPPRTQTVELSLKIAALFAGSSPRALNEDRLQPGRAFAHAGGASLAGALVVPGTQPRPGDEMPRGWEPAHVGADLSEENAGRQFPYAWNVGQDRDQLAKGREVGLDLLVDLGDGPVQRIDLLKMEA